MSAVGFLLMTFIRLFKNNWFIIGLRLSKARITDQERTVTENCIHTFPGEGLYHDIAGHVGKHQGQLGDRGSKRKKSQQ